MPFIFVWLQSKLEVLSFIIMITKQGIGLMNSFNIECSAATDEYVVNALNEKGIKHVVKGMKFLNDHGQEIEEADIDNNSGNPAKMLAGVVIELECDTDEGTLEGILEEVSDFEGVSLVIQ